MNFIEVTAYDDTPVTINVDEFSYCIIDEDGQTEIVFKGGASVYCSETPVEIAQAIRKLTEGNYIKVVSGPKFETSVDKF